MRFLEELRASGREVAVIGLGKSGVAAALLLRDHGIPVYASEIRASDTTEGWARPLRAAGATVELGAHNLERIASAAAAVVADARAFSPAFQARTFNSGNFQVKDSLP